MNRKIGIENIFAIAEREKENVLNVLTPSKTLVGEDISLHVVVTLNSSVQNALQCGRNCVGSCLTKGEIC